ncbi:MAG TPA: hypothetical protein VMT02_03635 [Burkholderiales bacterium]|nr:hypothetical protein [Burkholderiales bacterium]
MRRVLGLLPALLLSACAGLPADPDGRGARPARDVPRGEVAIVINGNAAGGRHAGLFAGPWLSDPSGSYVSQRSGSADWPGPSLADYVAFQLEDGDDVRVFRFRLSERDFAEVERRVRSAGATPPLFCAATVQSQIAGVGPFKEIPDTFWTSPKTLASHLQQLLGRPSIAGACLRPSGTPC